MHTIDVTVDPPVQHLARVSEKDGGDTDYRWACLLAEQVGLDLMDA
jgi:hypothetical protein